MMRDSAIFEEGLPDGVSRKCCFGVGWYTCSPQRFHFFIVFVKTLFYNKAVLSDKDGIITKTILGGNGWRETD